MNNVCYLHSDRWSVNGRCRAFINFAKNFKLQSFKLGTTRQLRKVVVNKPLTSPGDMITRLLIGQRSDGKLKDNKVIKDSEVNALTNNAGFA